MKRQARLKPVPFCAESYIKFAFVAVLCAAGAAPADWEVGDPASYYQSPDPVGWSIYAEPETEEYSAADNWTAGATAPITDIFFWGGWEMDVVGETGEIQIQIFNDNPADNGFPKTDECVWSRIITEGQYTARLFIDAPERNLGWYDPQGTDAWNVNDHRDMYQYCIHIINDPFIQQAGQTYWLMISTVGQGGWWGWSTAEGVSGGPAVFWDNYSSGWTQLSTPAGYPGPQTPLDLAFVIVPEPATLLLLALGAAIARKRRL
jgi:hypothetical protein